MKFFKTKFKEKIGYYCPTCGKTYEAINKYKFKTSNPKVQIYFRGDTSCVCECGSDALEIDLNMLPAIARLNKIGIITEFCCEGHGFCNPAYISFRTDIPYEELGVPEGWTLEKAQEKITLMEFNEKGETDTTILYCDTIRPVKLERPKCTFEEYKENYMTSLYRWINTLEKIQNQK